MPSFAEQNKAGNTSVDAGAAHLIPGKYLVLYWVGVSATEAASGYSFDMTCTDTIGNLCVQSGGVGDGNSPSSLQGAFSFEFIGGDLPFTFDIGVFSPVGLLRYDYNVVFQVLNG